MTEEGFKRNIAFHMRIGEILAGKPVIEAERMKHLEVPGKNVVRVNLIANIVDKYIQDGEKKFGSVTLDDASGQIKLKVFGEEIEKFTPFNQGDTVLVVGLLRSWNNEVYITPEIMKKKEPAFLLIRKLELDKEQAKIPNREQIIALKDKIVELVKAADKDGGVNVETLIMELKESPEIINTEIKKLLESGTAYEPRPGKIRYLG